MQQCEWCGQAVERVITSPKLGGQFCPLCHAQLSRARSLLKQYKGQGWSFDSLKSLMRDYLAMSWEALEAKYGKERDTIALMAQRLMIVVTPANRPKAKPTRRSWLATLHDEMGRKHFPHLYADGAYCGPATKQHDINLSGLLRTTLPPTSCKWIRIAAQRKGKQL